MRGSAGVAAGVAGRGGGGVPLEVAGEVRLIVEADGGGDVGERCAAEDEAAGGVDAAADHVRVRAQAELPGEAPHQMRMLRSRVAAAQARLTSLVR